MTNSKIPYWRTTFGKGEVSAITKAIESEYISQGPIVAELERQLAEYLEVPYVVATTSGSTALLMSLLASEVKPADEVIVPNRSWIASAHAPFLLGATVKLIDVEVDRPIINARLIEDAITEKTRVIIPVHMCGRSADMRFINKIAQKVGEEAVELVIEAKDNNETLFLDESADLLFHYLILLQAKGYALKDVVNVLEKRHKS